MGTNDVILRNLGEIPVPLQAAIVVAQLDAVPRALLCELASIRLMDLLRDVIHESCKPAAK